MITATHLAALRPMLRSPTTYTQRLVEHLEFLPQGGQVWRRDLQILIPEVEGLSEGESHWFIVSLGQFIRRRLPDFAVHDCAGRALNLLTRVQHGHCLADFTIDQYLYDPERDRLAALAASKPAGPLLRSYAKLYLPTFEMFTSVREELAPVAEQSMVSLLRQLGASADQANGRAELFMSDMTAVAKVTQYLCWVRARPGLPVRLTATYTMPDPSHLAGPEPGHAAAERLTRWRARSRSWRSEQYARFGLGPVHCSFPAPANDHTASYYFSLEPPPESGIPYLDWGLDNTIEGDGREWVCAHNSVHIHNGSGLRSIDEPSEPRKQIPESKIHAFLRVDPADHKQVMFAAFLNLVFVWLAEAGRLNTEIDSATAPWLALAPAVLLAYTAQQRRHYFARATRWIRIVLWLYLLLDIAFLVSISFDIAPSGSFADRHGFSDDAVSILMAAASIFVFWLFAFLGKPYDWVVRQSFRWVRRRSSNKGESAVHSYVRVARWYGNLVAGLISASLVAMAVFLLGGYGPHRAQASNGSEKTPQHVLTEGSSDGDRPPEANPQPQATFPSAPTSDASPR